MKVLFDLSATQPSNGITYHGGSEYTKAIFTKLTETNPSLITVFYSDKFPLDNVLIDLINEYNIPTLKDTSNVALERFILEKRINIFYSPLPKSDYIPLLKLQSGSFKMIFTIHGLRALERPTDRFEWIYDKSLKKRIKIFYKKVFPGAYKNSILKYFTKLLEADKIITVSNHSANSLFAFFPFLDSKKVLTFYSPILDYLSHCNISNEHFVLKHGLISKKYFLILSGSIWEKNSYRAIKAFDELLSQNSGCKDYQMLVTGLKEVNFKVRNFRNFVYTAYLSRDKLEGYLKNSFALVYPSLSEGFGYPPLEAMKYGIPVLASGIGAISEVCGTAAEYFDPENSNDIKVKLLSAIKNNKLHSDTNIRIRQDRYKLIHERQESDLIKLTNLLLN